TRFSRDWSSDVCSSDLVPSSPPQQLPSSSGTKLVPGTVVAWVSLSLLSLLELLDADVAPEPVALLSDSAAVTSPPESPGPHANETGRASCRARVQLTGA